MERLDRLTELAEGAVSGGRPALEALLRASLPLAHAIARGRLGDGAAAADAAAEALAKVGRGVDRLKSAAAYPAWLRRIVLRCAVDARRAMPKALEAQLTPRIDPRPGPVETAAATERVEAVRGAVGRLSAELREAVLLHYLEGLSYREVASILGKGLGTVARRMKRAHGELRAALEEMR